MRSKIQRSRVGLALGGGGMRGLAHIGVLKALEEEGITIDYIAGTSMGGVIAALFGTGLHADEIALEFKRLAKLKNIIKLVDWLPGTRSLMPGHKVYDYLCRVIGAETTFTDLQIPVAMTAVDLLSLSEVILNHGRVVDAVRATIAVPGVFAPVALGDQLLVDGGILNNVPVDLAYKMGAEYVIAVDVGFGEVYVNDENNGNTPFPGMTPTIALDLWRTTTIMIKAITDQKLNASPPDVLLHPEVSGGVGILVGFTQMAETIAAGEAAVRGAIPQIRAALAARSRV